MSIIFSILPAVAFPLFHLILLMFLKLPSIACLLRALLNNIRGFYISLIPIYKRYPYMVFRQTKYIYICKIVNYASALHTLRVQKNAKKIS